MSLINYIKTNWINGVTQRNATNFNHMEDGIKSACDGVDALSEMITDEYSQKTYVVGDYCIKDNVLYKCNTAIAAAEEWTASHWTATTIGYEFKSVNKASVGVGILDTTYVRSTGEGVKYRVVNGVCIVHIEVILTNVLNDLKPVISGLPLATQAQNICVPAWGTDAYHIHCVANGGNIYFSLGGVEKAYGFTVIYPTI